MGRPVSLLLLLLLTSFPTRSSAQRAVDDVGLTGTVLAPDGRPVAGGAVSLLLQRSRVTASIQPDGHFSLRPDLAETGYLFVNVPGLAPFRIRVTVPPSRSVKLPPLRLWPPTYFRVRFISPDGQPVTAPNLRRESLDPEGTPIVQAPDQRIAIEVDANGTTTIGPLPLGKTLLALDNPPFALSRLPDLDVGPEATLLDGGTVVLQIGAVLNVDVVDDTGAPVSDHVVTLEDVARPSPLPGRTVHTDRDGRAAFDRLAAGRYRLRTSAAKRCGNRSLALARTVSVSGTGTLRTRLVAGGSARFRFTSALGPIGGLSVSASPDAGPPSPSLLAAPLLLARGVPSRPFETACHGTTDADGRIDLANFPPGPARIDVRLPNSTYARHTSVPQNSAEMEFTIPDGLLSVRVIQAATKRPIGGATAVWTGAGVRVEGTTVATGDALLEGVAASPGVLEVSAAGYTRAELKLVDPFNGSHEVTLSKAPLTSIDARITAAGGDPVANAVVELVPENPASIGHIAVGDAKGRVLFADLPPGALRLTAHADGFTPSSLRIPHDRRGEVMLTMSPSGVARMRDDFGALTRARR